MRSSIFATGIALALLALPALAQAPAAPSMAPAPAASAPPAAPAGTPTRVRGTIVKLDGNMLTVKPKTGANVTVALAPNFRVSKLVKKKLTDIKTGDFVASTGMKHPDGSIHAVEIRIFPEALRGRGEGQFPWDLSPDSVMTNATVSGIAAAPKGKTFTVTYKGTTSTYIVDPTTPIFAQEDGDAGLLKPKVYVVVLASKHPDGTIAGAAVAATADGVRPRM
jgi:hypothetical protein